MSFSEPDLERIKNLAYGIEVHIHNFLGRTELNEIYGGLVPLSIHAKAILDWAEEIQKIAHAAQGRIGSKT